MIYVSQIPLQDFNEIPPTFKGDPLSRCHPAFCRGVCGMPLPSAVNKDTWWWSNGHAAIWIHYVSMGCKNVRTAKTSYCKNGVYKPSVAAIAELFSECFSGCLGLFLLIYTHVAYSMDTTVSLVYRGYSDRLCTCVEVTCILLSSLLMYIDICLCVHLYIVCLVDIW